MVPTREKKRGATKRKKPPPPPSPGPIAPPAPDPAVPPPGPAAHLPPAPPFGGWWPGSGLSGSSPCPQENRSLNPWAAYVNLIQQSQFASPSENFHFVGLTHNTAPISPSPPPSAQGKTSPQGTGQVPIDIDGDDSVEASSMPKRRHWSHEEEVRLASAWLNNSKDPKKGNDKKSESFWRGITEEFNSNAPADRKRDTNQLKVHWSRLHTTINDFNGCWAKVTKVNKSGVSDDQLMDEALKMYAERYKKAFTLVHWWRTLKNEPKWCAYVAQLEKEKNQSQQPIPVADEERPIGRDAAKAQRSGKRKAEEIIEGIALLGENIEKIVAVTQERKQEREKVTEAQLEISRLKVKAAQEEKEAKLVEKEAKLLDKEAKLLLVYNSLLQQDTSQMTEESKARREKSLVMMEKKLFGNDDEV